MLDDLRVFRACHRCLLAMVGVSLLVGVLLTTAASTALFSHYNQSTADAFYGGHPLEGAALAHHQWLLGVTGAGTIGWAVTLLFLVAIPFARKELWAWWCFVVSVALWVVVDAAASIYWGVGGEVVFVVAGGLALLTPALVARRFFGRSSA